MFSFLNFGLLLALQKDNKSKKFKRGILKKIKATTYILYIQNVKDMFDIIYTKSITCKTRLLISLFYKTLELVDEFKYVLPFIYIVNRDK